MTDEIKEILQSENIHIIESNGKWNDIYGYEKSQLKNDLIDYITTLQEENKRLNNIINELEKWLENEKDYYFENYYYSDFNAYGSKCNDVLDKIKELKENK